MPDKDELHKLRLSLARVADTLGVKDPLLENPVAASQHVDRGWNRLAGLCVGKAVELHNQLERVGGAADDYRQQVIDQLAESDGVGE